MLPQQRPPMPHRRVAVLFHSRCPVLGWRRSQTALLSTAAGGERDLLTSEEFDQRRFVLTLERAVGDRVGVDDALWRTGELRAGHRQRSCCLAALAAVVADLPAAITGRRRLSCVEPPLLQLPCKCSGSFGQWSSSCAASHSPTAGAFEAVLRPETLLTTIGNVSIA